MADPKQYPEEDAKDFSADQLYMVLCFVALVVTFVGLEEFGEIALVPLFLGAMAMWFRWTSVPVVWLLVLGFLLGIQFTHGNARFFSRQPRDTTTIIAFRGMGPAVTFLTCGAALVFTIGYCRRLVLLDGGFPGSARTTPPAQSDGRALKPARRDPPQGVVAELTPILVTVVICCAAGYFLWLLLVRVPRPEEVPFARLYDEWGLLVLCWLVAVAGSVGMLAAGYLERSRATPEQSLLYLQDQLWRETRREQSRLSRWLVWARLRGQRRKEKT